MSPRGQFYVSPNIRNLLGRTCSLCVFAWPAICVVRRWLHGAGDLQIVDHFCSSRCSMDVFLPLPTHTGGPRGRNRHTRPLGFDEHDGLAPPRDAQPLRHGYVLGRFRVFGGGDEGVQTVFLGLGAFGGSIALGDGAGRTGGHGVGFACDVRRLVPSSTRASGVAFASGTSFGCNCWRVPLLGAIRCVLPDRISRSVRSSRSGNREGLVVALGICVGTARFCSLGLCLCIGPPCRRGLVSQCREGCADWIGASVRGLPCCT